MTVCTPLGNILEDRELGDSSPESSGQSLAGSDSSSAARAKALDRALLVKKAVNVDVHRSMLLAMTSIFERADMAAEADVLIPLLPREYRLKLLTALIIAGKYSRQDAMDYINDNPLSIGKRKKVNKNKKQTKEEIVQAASHSNY